MRGVAAILTLALASPAFADKPADQGIDDNLPAAEAEAGVDNQPWNEVDLKLLTVRIGGGVGFDAATYGQTSASNEQMPISADQGLRDFRFLLKGRFPWWSRLSYTVGYMFDGPTDSWHFRQTGLMLDVKELQGRLFVGRTKEGFSTSKIMVGYYTWTMERSAANEAFIPILADGIKWTGTLFDNAIVYNAGFFIDTWSETESFDRNDKQGAARVVYLPWRRDAVLHLAAEGRLADADNGMLQFKARPEAFQAQVFAVDTGKFAADYATMLGVEAYYRQGPLTLGSEYYFNKVKSSSTGDPLFHGGEVFGAYVFTGEVRPYNEKGAFFEDVRPTRSVFEHGLGAIELVMRWSYVDLDDGTIEGGKFWRITPQVNWYLSDNLRLELAYGYGRLDRFGVSEGTQFVQSRVQFTLM